MESLNVGNAGFPVVENGARAGAVPVESDQRVRFVDDEQGVVRFHFEGTVVAFDGRFQLVQRPEGIAAAARRVAEDAEALAGYMRGEWGRGRVKNEKARRA